MMKTKVRFCKVRSPQIKKCKKETSFKIQFYIGIHLSGIVLGCFSDLSAMSPSPSAHPTCKTDENFEKITVFNLHLGMSLCMLVGNFEIHFTPDLVFLQS